MLKGYVRGVHIVAIGAALTFVPFHAGDGFYPQAEAASANAGGKGWGGENKKGANKAGTSALNKPGSGVEDGALKKGRGRFDTAGSAASTESKISRRDMGRLNSLLNASSTVLRDAAPNSAIGIESATPTTPAVSGLRGGQVPGLDMLRNSPIGQRIQEMMPQIQDALSQVPADAHDMLKNSTLGSRVVATQYGGTTNDPAVDNTNTERATSIADLINALPDTKANQDLAP
jgi:hypothetical protein